MFSGGRERVHWEQMGCFNLSFIGALLDFFLLRLLCISINLPQAHVWNTVVTSGLVLPVATWNCKTSYKNEYAGLMVLHLLLLLNLGSSSKCGQLKSLLQVLLWQMFFRTVSTGSASFFSREVYSLFRQILCQQFLSSHS